MSLIKLSRIELFLQQCGLAKDIRCVKMGDVSYRFGWLKSGGKGSLMRRMLSSMMSAAPDTPSVAASGATTVWANGPIAPPTNAPILKRLRDTATLTIGFLDMGTMHVGSLADKIKRVRNEHSTRSDRE